MSNCKQILTKYILLCKRKKLDEIYNIIDVVNSNQVVDNYADKDISTIKDMINMYGFNHRSTMIDIYQEYYLMKGGFGLSKEIKNSMKIIQNEIMKGFRVDFTHCSTDKLGKLEETINNTVKKHDNEIKKNIKSALKKIPMGPTGIFIKPFLEQALTESVFLQINTMIKDQLSKVKTKVKTTEFKKETVNEDLIENNIDKIFNNIFKDLSESNKQKLNITALIENIKKMVHELINQLDSFKSDIQDKVTEECKQYHVKN